MTEITGDFSPQLKSTVEIHPFETIEDDELVLLRNPEEAAYLKLKKKAQGIVEKMDGRTTVAQLQEMYQDIDVYHLVSVLAKTGFLTGIEPKKYRSPLHTVNVPFFDTDTEFFRKIYRLFKFTGSKPFLLVYSLFILSGFFLFLQNFGEILDNAYVVFYPDIPLRYLLVDFAIFYVVEFTHELAHTGASYNCGAKPGKLGLTFHFFVAFFYVETPDTRILGRRGNICTFISGPLLSLLAAEISTYVFLFTDSMPIVWASSSFFWHISTVITLAPFMQTDGYYIVQYLVKFPNLLDNSILYAKTQVRRFFQLLSEDEYTKIMSKWNRKQKKFLRVYMVLWPIQTVILTYFFFFSVNKMHALKVLTGLPQILSSENPYGIKGYFLIIFYAWGIIAGVLPVALTIRKYILKRRNL